MREFSEINLWLRNAVFLTSPKIKRRRNQQTFERREQRGDLNCRNHSSSEGQVRRNRQKTSIPVSPSRNRVFVILSSPNQKLLRNPTQVSGPCQSPDSQSVFYSHQLAGNDHLHAMITCTQYGVTFLSHIIQAEMFVFCQQYGHSNRLEHAMRIGWC